MSDIIDVGPEDERPEDERPEDEQSTNDSEIVKDERPEVKFERISGRKLNIPEGASVIDAIVSSPSDELRPWATVTLPSEGLFYEDSIPGGVVRVRPMGMAADKILATQRLAQSGKSLDYLFKNCVDLPNGFDPLSLLAGDRAFLLYYLRGITHGNMYDFIIQCSNCEVRSELSYDLNNIEVVWVNAGLGDEPFKIVLEYMSDMASKEVWAKVRFLRGYDLLKMTSQLKKNRRLKPNKKFQQEQSGSVDMQVIDQTLADNLSALIVEIGSGTETTSDRSTINKFVDRLHSSDHATIREFLNDNSPNINTEITVECEHCGHEMVMPLPVTESFFRPQRQVDDE